MADLTTDARIEAARDIAVSLLPGSASLRERALLTAELARLSVYSPELIATIWNPATCAVALLPWLAWAVSADVWDTQWPVATKRAVIAAAPGVHRLKGTRVAVRLALDALHIRTDIAEWWETDPVGRRGTATVTAYVSAAFEDGGVVLSERIQRQAIASIRASKPKSRFVAYRIGVGFRSAIGALADLQQLAALRPTLTSVVAMPEATLGTLDNLQNVAALRSTMEPDTAMPAALAAIFGVASSLQFLSVTMEARA